jgi:hypothetical protein
MTIASTANVVLNTAGKAGTVIRRASSAAAAKGLLGA